MSFNLSVTAQDLDAAVAKANAAAPQSTTYTKSAIDTALAGKADLVGGKIPASELPSTDTATQGSSDLMTSGGVYTELGAKVNTSDLANTVITLKIATNIPSNSDLNNFKTPGNYYCAANSASTVSNKATNGGFRLLVKVEMLSEVKLEQIFNPEQSYKEYKRYLVGDTWSDWKVVQDDLSSYATVSYVDGLIGNINAVLEEVL